MFKSRVTTYSLFFIAFLYFGALFADFISPYPYDVQFRHYPYHPPTPIHFFDEKGNFHIVPFVYGHKLVDPVRKLYTVDLRLISAKSTG